MMDPRYQEVASEQIPEVTLTNGTTVKIIAGELSGTQGPVQNIVIEPEYIDVAVPANSEFRHSTKQGHTVFAYITGGQGDFGRGKNASPYKAKGTTGFGTHPDSFVGNGVLVLFDDGDEIVVFTGKQKVSFLLISGKPIGETIAWHGPIVMNTRKELEVAFEEYRQGTFIKCKG